MKSLATKPTSDIEHSHGVCFHCGEAIPTDCDLALEIEGSTRPVCCHGCLAVSEFILTNELGAYYSFRTREALTPEKESVFQTEDALKAYDHPKLQQSFVRKLDENDYEAHLILEGIVCPACTWLIERHLSGLDGIHDINVNYTTNQARLVWRPGQIALSEILQAIKFLGYHAYPYAPAAEQALYNKERKKQLQRIGLAGLLGMQVMMISIALYAGIWETAQAMKGFLQWIALILTVPVVFYSAIPFYSSALRDLRKGYTGMDIPVSLGIGFAFIGSVWSTATGRGDVYFDSVVMFVFFLLLGRYFEFNARKNNREYLNRICQILPAMTTKLVDDDGGYREEVVPVMDLKPGDKVLIRAGDTVPADGVVAAGTSTVNESLITGETVPVKRTSGQALIGGSTNVDSPLQLIVERTGQETFISQIIGLVERSLAERQRFHELIHKVAGWFVFAVLIIASLVAWYWFVTLPDRWLPITLSVLVATCPCALALAAPTANTVALSRLLRSGIAVTRKQAIEKLSRATHYIFDKTGTLTEGDLHVEKIDCLGGKDKHTAIRAAIALERYSEHPIARAIRRLDTKCESSAVDIINYPGEGMTGIIGDKRYYIGSLSFVESQLSSSRIIDIPTWIHSHPGPVVALADSSSMLCFFALTDRIRADAIQLIDSLKKARKKIVLLSGDKEASVRHIAKTLNIDEYHYQLKPADKVDYLHQLKGGRCLIAMVGDGINDAPVLAASDIAIAMGSGADLARIHADLILLNNKMDTLRHGIATAQSTYRIIRQNILWAISYNIVILPSAAAGLVAPWMAAIGMSLSSLLVVGNAHRIKFRS